MNDTQSIKIAAALGQALLRRGWQVSAAESCTGGGIAQAITAIDGSSQWFESSFVTYSNQSKSELLGVPQALLSEQGAVCEATVTAMAKGAIMNTNADIAVAVSGIAGPTGGSPERPVGSVWIAWCQAIDRTQSPGLFSTMARYYHFDGDRYRIRQQAIEAALSGLLTLTET